MVIYNCFLCNFTTNIKTNYNTHLNTKKHNNNEQIHQASKKEKSTKEHNSPKKVAQKSTKLSQNVNCDFCNLKFKTKANMRRHIKNYCKKMNESELIVLDNKVNDIEYALKFQQNQHEKEKKFLYKQIELLLGKVGNTTINNTNNIQLNNYGNEDEIEKQAFYIANSFFSMLNKPESITAIRLAVSKHKDFWRKTLKYCAEGNFLAMMEEYVYMLKNCNSITSTNETAELMQNILSVRTSSVDVDLKNRDSSYATQKMRAHYAVAYGEQKMSTDAGSKRMINIRDVFNSPFRPFVLASTSVGQEGLDFHFYCRKIFHWNLPHNAIDLEQREGRINRFKGLVIRSKITDIVDDDILLNAMSENSISIWNSIFEIAKSLFKEDKTGIIPFWYLDEGKNNLERFVPIHKFSKDQRKYEQLKVTLALYRMTFGQPRQEELIYALKNSGLEDKDINKLRELLMINLSPMNRH